MEGFHYIAFFPGICPAGSSGDRRYGICNATADETIVFDTLKMCNNAIPCTITLAAPLLPMAVNLRIDGGEFGRAIVDGNNAYRAFFIDQGTTTIANLQIQHVYAKGGNGGDESSVSGNQATSGGAGGGGTATAGTADPACVFSYQGMVNGASVAGPAASALPNATPTP